MEGRGHFASDGSRRDNRERPEFKDVLIDGLPKEDGAYLVLLNGATEHGARERYLVRYTFPDGRRIWAGGTGCQINESEIVMYLRIHEHKSAKG